MNVACDAAILRELKMRFDLLCREQGISCPDKQAALAREIFADLDAASLAILVVPQASADEPVAALP